MHRFRSTPVPVAAPLAAALVLLLAACSQTASAPSESAAATPSAATSSAPSESAEESEEASEEVKVTLEGFAFDTEELTIPAGTEVSFLNADGAAHTVTEGTDGQAADDPILDEELAPNKSTSHTFDEPGTYEITCLFHPSMNMTITVEG